MQKHREPLFKCYHQLNKSLQSDKENQAGFLYIVHHSKVLRGLQLMKMLKTFLKSAAVNERFRSQHAHSCFTASFIIKDPLINANEI